MRIAALTCRSSGWQRFAAARLRPDQAADLIGRVEERIYIVGDKSWLIDMERYNFHSTVTVLPDPRRPLGRPAARCRLSGHDLNRLLEFHEAVGGGRPGGGPAAFNLRQAKPDKIAPVKPRCCPSASSGRQQCQQPGPPRAG